jgi:hypothetical protein
MDITIDNLVVSKLSTFEINKVFDNISLKFDLSGAKIEFFLSSWLIIHQSSCKNGCKLYFFQGAFGA